MKLHHECVRNAQFLVNRFVSNFFVMSTKKPPRLGEGEVARGFPCVASCETELIVARTRYKVTSRVREKRSIFGEQICI